MNKKLTLGLFLCNMLGIFSNIFGMYFYNKIEFFRYIQNENKNSDCQILRNGFWQTAKTKIQSLDKDFPNPINCILDLNIASNENKIILKMKQNQIAIKSKNFKLAILTLLQSELTEQKSLFVKLTTYERHEDNPTLFTSTTTFYQVTEILKPQMVQVPVHVKYYRDKHGCHTLEQLENNKWKPSTKNDTDAELSCKLKFSTNTAIPSSMQRINKKTNQPEGGESSIETPSPKAQKLIKKAHKPDHTHLLIEIGNDLYWVTDIEIDKQNTSNEQPSDEEITDKHPKKVQLTISSNSDSPDKKPVPGYTKTQIIAFAAIAIGIITILSHLHDIQKQIYSLCS